MLTYYTVELIAPDGSTCNAHCLADSPEQAAVLIQAEVLAEGMEATIGNVTAICRADLRSLHDSGLLMTLTVQEFSEVLAAEILVTNQAVDMVAKQLIAKSQGRCLGVDRSKELAGPMYDHSDEPCYSINRGTISSPTSKNVVLNSVFSALWA